MATGDDEPAGEGAERRAAPRDMAVLRVAKLITERGEQLCRIRNISPGGVMAEVPGHFFSGEPAAIELKSGGKAAGRIAWVDAGRIGIAFHEPIDPEDILAIDPDLPPRALCICGSIARSFGRRIRCGQLSMIAGAIVLSAMSASDWVANTTATFFLRSTFSHSRMRAANSGWSRKTQASSRTSKVGRPVSLVASGEDQTRLGAAAPPDALAGAPRSYGDVPQLGAPLPGDLGRPILEHQREVGAVPAAPATDAAQQAAQAAETERQRLAAEQRSARQSGVMMQLASAGQAAAPAPMTGAATGPTTSTPETQVGRIALDPERDPNNQQRKQDFVGQRDATSDVNPHGLTPAVSPYTLHAGSVIAASLITGLNSDLPGLVTAQVTENAYDSVTGRIPLIPQGSRLIGSYDSVVAFGQSRALVVWQRIILPDGSSIRIDNVPATDMAGYAGLADRIDRHTWQLLKGVVLSTMLGVGTELSFGSTESDLVRAIRESAQQSGARAGDQIVTRNLNMQPTLRVRPGWPLRVVVHKDIVLRPWGGRRG